MAAPRASGTLNAYKNQAQITVAIGVSLASGGVATEFMIAQRTRTVYTMLGSGLVGGGAGELTLQAEQKLTGDRTDIDWQRVGVYSLASAGLNYGLNRVLTPPLLLDRLGNAEVEALSEAQELRDIAEKGMTDVAPQLRFRTPDPTASPIADHVVLD